MDIGERLGHDEISTTARYLKRLRKADNEYAAKLEDYYGL
jgi:hypothetical protein